MSGTLEAARALFEAGISVVAVHNDGSKRPRGEWKQYQTRRANQQELIQWFGTGYPAIGVVTGDISGNLEMAEIEGRAAEQLPALEELAYESGLGPLWEKLAGWIEESPSGGVHWFYRLTSPPAGNTKLASRPATPEELAENPHEKRKVLAETRGQGGFVVTAPSNGTTHETGKSWRIMMGGPETIPTLTPEEHEAFHALLMTLNVEPPEPAPAPRQGPTVPASGIFGGVSPGDDFEAKTDWRDILVPAGWQYLRTTGRTRHWRRPGKDSGEGSATTGNSQDRDRLWVFSSSTEFEQEVPYTKFGAYALLNHGGDHSAAASALRGKGYGQDLQVSTGAAPSNQTSVFSSSPAVPAGAPGSAEAPPHTIGPARTAGPATDQSWQTTGTLATVTDIATKQHQAAPASTIAHSDDGNAALLIHAKGNVLRYCPDFPAWLWWNGTRWEQQAGDGGMARELAKETIRALEPDNEAARTHKRKSLSNGAIGAMLQMATTDLRVRVKADELDARGWELNTPAGIVDLRTATIRPHEPESLHTKMTAVAPDFGAISAEWEQFLNTTFGGNQELIGYIQQLAGYSIIGEVLEHILPFAFGAGGNGKGVLFEALQGVLGPDYATTAPSGFLMKQQYQDHSAAIARLKGARLVICSEVNAGDKFDEAKMKELAGGDRITARFMRGNYFTFEPSHQLWLMGNHQPGVEAGGDGFWRRLRLIPFLHTVPDEQIIVGLGRKLVAEHGAAVLAWVIRGAAVYAGNRRLIEPDQVKQATRDYSHDVDTVARFLEDECEVGNPTHCMSVKQLRARYERYCAAENGEQPLKGKAFTAALNRHGIRTGDNVPRGTGGFRQYEGVRLMVPDWSSEDGIPPPEDNYQQPVPGF